jgi:mannose/fructose/N-acetylgalactosamine-specific phosphotransferase system component IIC
MPPRKRSIHIIGTTLLIVLVGAMCAFDAVVVLRSQSSSTVANVTNAEPAHITHAVIVGGRVTPAAKNGR